MYSVLPRLSYTGVRDLYNWARLGKLTIIELQKMIVHSEKVAWEEIFFDPSQSLILYL